MEITGTVEPPSQKCSLDVEGPLTETENGSEYVWTFQFYFSKFVIATSIRQHDADTVSREFVAHLTLKYGIPATVSTEEYAKFRNKMFKVCKLLQIKKYKHQLFHPESKGEL